jgi:hypothetical protein
MASSTPGKGKPSFLVQTTAGGNGAAMPTIIIKKK